MRHTSGRPRRWPGAIVPAIAAGLLVLGAGSAAAQVADAAMMGDRAEVEKLLRSGADVNLPQGDGMTALHWAAENGDAGMVAMLVTAGANLEAVSRIGDYTPLHVASEAGAGGAVRALLEAGADPEARRAFAGTTSLHLAAAAGSAPAIEALLDFGASIDVRESRWGQTPLIFAAARNRVDAVRTLLARGADPALTTKVLELSLRAEQDRQARQARQDMMDTMRQNSSDPIRWVPRPAEVRAAVAAASRFDALEPAEEVNRIDWHSAQLEGMRLRFPDLVGYQGGLTALLHAVREGNGETVEALLEGGADINQPSAGDLTTPLLMAVINGHFDLGMELLRMGADPSLASDAGTTPLYAALNAHWTPKARYPQQQAYQQQEVGYLEVIGGTPRGRGGSECPTEQASLVHGIHLRPAGPRLLGRDAVLPCGPRPRHRGDGASGPLRCRSVDPDTPPRREDAVLHRHAGARNREPARSLRAAADPCGRSRRLPDPRGHRLRRHECRPCGELPAPCPGRMAARGQVPRREARGGM